MGMMQIRPKRNTLVRPLLPTEYPSMLTSDSMEGGEVLGYQNNTKNNTKFLRHCLQRNWHKRQQDHPSKDSIPPSRCKSLHHHFFVLRVNNCVAIAV